MKMIKLILAVGLGIITIGGVVEAAGLYIAPVKPLPSVQVGKG